MGGAINTPTTTSTPRLTKCTSPKTCAGGAIIALATGALKLRLRSAWRGANRWRASNLRRLSLMSHRLLLANVARQHQRIQRLRLDRCQLPVLFKGVGHGTDRDAIIPLLWAAGTARGDQATCRPTPTGTVQESPLLSSIRRTRPSYHRDHRRWRRCRKPR